MTPARWVALGFTAIVTTFIMVASWHITSILSAPDWCARAVLADKASNVEPRVDVMTGCIGLLLVQLKSLAVNSHILMSTLALSVAVLAIVVLADAKFRGSWNGAEGEVSGRDVPWSRQPSPSPYYGPPPETHGGLDDPDAPVKPEEPQP